MEPTLKPIQSGTHMCALNHGTPMSLGKGPCHLQPHRMVLQTISTENGRERGHTKAGEPGDFPLEPLPGILIHSSLPPTRLISSRTAMCCISSVPSVLSTVPGIKQPLKNMCPKEHTGHINHASKVLSLVY